MLDVSPATGRSTYLSIEGAAIRNRRIEDRRVANQEPMNTYNQSLPSASDKVKRIISHTLSLDKRRNPKRRVLQEIILGSLDIRSNPIPRNGIAN